EITLNTSEVSLYLGVVARFVEVYVASCTRTLLTPRTLHGVLPHTKRAPHKGATPKKLLIAVLLAEHHSRSQEILVGKTTYGLISFLELTSDVLVRMHWGEQ